MAEQAFTPRNQADCSAYVKDVAHRLGEWLPDVNADGLIEYMRHDPSFTQLGSNDVEASKMSGQHYFVIAGFLNEFGHGHVAVIVPGRQNGYAIGFWGSLNDPRDAGENKGIDYAFPKSELSKVEYFAVPAAALAHAPR